MPAAIIQDLAFNPLADQAQGQMIGFIEGLGDETANQLKIYNFIIEAIRIEDAKSTLFLKRMLEGPQQQWDDTWLRIFSIKLLNDLQNVDDEFLPFIKNLLGWTSELDGITDRLTFDQLRKLIGASVPLWKGRGPEDAITNVLNLVTGARNRIWNWFDFNWILDETAVGEDHQGRDSWIIDLPGPPNSDDTLSNVRIVDDGSLDRILVVELIKLMRATGERIEISYITFLDQFISAADTGQWRESADETGVSSLLVADGLATIPNPLALSKLKAVVDVSIRLDSSDWDDYVCYWRVRGDGIFGGIVYWLDEENYTRIEVDTTLNRARLIVVVATVENTEADIDLSTLLMVVPADIFVGLRVQVANETPTTRRTKVYIDEQEVINESYAIGEERGRVGLYRASAATGVEFDEIEMFQLPLTTELVDINS